MIFVNFICENSAAGSTRHFQKRLLYISSHSRSPFVFIPMLQSKDSVPKSHNYFPKGFFKFMMTKLNTIRSDMLLFSMHHGSIRHGPLPRYIRCISIISDMICLVYACSNNINHCSDITPGGAQITGNSMIVQWLVKANDKENIEVPHYWPFCEGNPHKGPVMLPM